MSIMEMSHRSRDFVAVMDNAEAGLRRIMGIPDNYEVLFLQGGASLQFAMVPMNLYLQGNPVDVINTGAWTQKAMVEIERIAAYRLAASTEPENFTRLPDPNRIRLDETRYRRCPVWTDFCRSPEEHWTRRSYHCDYAAGVSGTRAEDTSNNAAISNPHQKPVPL
jgi:hypothetical protein